MPKLFIPGPTEVLLPQREAQTRPMIGHRSKDYAALHASIEERLKKIMFTENRVFISTSSATGVIEAALKNAVKKKVLVPSNGAFSKKWASVAESCGLEAVRLEYELGKAVKPEDIEKALAEDPEIDAVMLTHSETSTGVLSPLKEIAAVVQKFENVVLLVDAVSSFAAAEIRVDEWGIDLLLFGMQKALALPSGLAFCSVTPEILERSKDQPQGRKGYYFDFTEWEKAAAKNNTIITPALSLMFALDFQLGEIEKNGGIEKRWADHAEMQKITIEWADKKGIEYFSEAGFHSPGVSVLQNSLNWNIGELNEKLKAEHDTEIANGYKDLKEKTFRIGHMGDHTPDGVRELLQWIDELTAA
ncbi:MAG: alanine--glyoxylate aminotransferase family protein [Candidatus Peribacteraceae bacterium]|nr:alanine--glyoxylate aminotransferase family protein [Candidatus Peribacteraceae bacterium]